MNLKNDKELEWSSVVANNRMNRERMAVGINSYEKDLKFNVIEFVNSRISRGNVKWLDLCCGQANALIQVSKHFTEKHEEERVAFKGIDLVDLFNPEYEKYAKGLNLACMNLSDWQPKVKYDLITIVHGLHYIGDKLALIIKAANSLKGDGLFIGHLDLQNVKLKNGANQNKLMKKYFREEMIIYNSRSRILKIEGAKAIQNKFEYLGSDDKAGPNYTGQAAVNSIYKMIGVE